MTPGDAIPGDVIRAHATLVEGDAYSEVSGRQGMVIDFDDFPWQAYLDVFYGHRAGALVADLYEAALDAVEEQGLLSHRHRGAAWDGTSGWGTHESTMQQVHRYLDARIATLAPTELDVLCQLAGVKPTREWGQSATLAAAEVLKHRGLAYIGYKVTPFGKATAYRHEWVRGRV